jgi:hypothetical protein
MDSIEDLHEKDIPTEIKNAANKAKERLMTYYSKTDATAFSIATLIDPRLKLFYHEEEKWERKYIEEARTQFQTEFKKYHQLTDVANSNEVDDIENNLTAQIYKQHKASPGGNEIDSYLEATRALPNTDILQWWKVNIYIYLFIYFNLYFFKNFFFL